jgi:hypothetical protein
MNQNRRALKRAIARLAGLFAGLAFATSRSQTYLRRSTNQQPARALLLRLR